MGQTIILSDTSHHNTRSPPGLFARPFNPPAGLILLQGFQGAAGIRRGSVSPPVMGGDAEVPGLITVKDGKAFAHGPLRRSKNAREGRENGALNV